MTRFLNAEYKQRKVDFDDISHIKQFAQEKDDPDNNPRFNEKYKRLTEKIRQIVEDFSLISMLPLDAADEETITDIIYHCDHIIQFGENQEADEKAYLNAESKLRQNTFGEGAEADDYMD